MASQETLEPLTGMESDGDKRSSDSWDEPAGARTIVGRKAASSREESLHWYDLSSDGETVGDRLPPSDGAPLTAIGPYRLLEPLGEGGMGVVYRAEDSRLQRTVAIKFLAPELAGDVRAKSRFLREARAAANLEHPNVCNVHEIGETDDGRMYMVMACYEGESLKQRLERGPLSVDETIRITRLVAAGLAKAHRAGIVHRDVKPANVFLTVDGEVKVLDFGIAKVRGDAAATQTGKLVGTPYYMAPEQLDGQVDVRCDIWALGVMIYEMLAGERPFSGPRAWAAVLTKPPPPLAEKRPDVPDFLVEIVRRALEKTPADRFQSIEELIAALPWTSEVATATAPTSALHPPPARPRRRFAASALAAAAGVAAALAGGWWLGTVGNGDVAAGTETALVPAADAPRTLAVLPFTVAGGGEYDYLGEGMVDLLSTKLDGAGELGAVRPRVLLRRLGELAADGVDLASWSTVAHELDADLVVLGNIVEVAGQLRFDATLHRLSEPAGGPSARGAEIASGSVEGSATEIFSLVDRLAAQLLAGMADGAGARMRRLATLTSESFTALKSYLEAEREWRAGDFSAAAEGFEIAVAEDPEFALAWYRLANARSWLLDVEGSEEALAQAIRHGDRLAVDDRRLLQALAAADEGDFETAERLYLEVLARRDDDFEAWIALGETQFHTAPLFGRSLRHSRRAWERVLELEPDDRQALLHLTRLDLYEQDFPVVRRRSERLLALLEGSERASEPLFFLAMLPGAHDERQRLREILLASELGIPWFSAGFTLSSSPKVVETWASFYEELLEPGRTRREKTFGHRHLGIFALAAGRLADGDEHLARASFPPEPEQEYRVLAAAAPVVPIDEASLRERIRTAEAWPTRSVADFSLFHPHARFPAHERLYVLALLASRSGDAQRALALADELAAAGAIDGAPGLDEDLVRAVRADVAWRAGRHEEVLDLLAERHSRYNYKLTLMSPILSQARSRFLKAEALFQLGRFKESLAWFETLSELNAFDLVYLATSFERRAEIHEKLGEPERAEELYRRFVDLWRDCDSELWPRVEAARERLRAL